MKPAFSLLLIGLLLAIALMSVTPVRSAVMSFLTRVGGLSFDVTTDYPGDNYPEDEEITIESRALPLNEAVALLPYPVYLPQNVVLEQEVAVSELSPGNFHIFLRGRTQQGVRFNMYILTNPDTNGGEIIFPDSAEEIFLDADHPAALIRGGWNGDTKVGMIPMGACVSSGCWTTWYMTWLETWTIWRRCWKWLVPCCRDFSKPHSNDFSRLDD